jgi:hypothetical protein
MKYRIVPMILKKITTITQINCMFPSNLLWRISTSAIIGNKKINAATNKIIINSVIPKIPRNIIFFKF